MTYCTWFEVLAYDTARRGEKFGSMQVHKQINPHVIGRVD